MRSPRVEIANCTQCRWPLSAARRVTFDAASGAAALAPGAGGVFEVRMDDTPVWSQRDEGRFPEAKELKQRVRDIVAPEVVLGHLETAKAER